MEGKRRTRYFQLRVSEEERSRMIELARREGMPLSKLIRMRVLKMRKRCQKVNNPGKNGLPGLHINEFQGSGNGIACPPVVDKK